MCRGSLTFRQPQSKHAPITILGHDKVHGYQTVYRIHPQLPENHNLSGVYKPQNRQGAWPLRTLVKGGVQKPPPNCPNTGEKINYLYDNFCLVLRHFWWRSAGYNYTVYDDTVYDA